MSYKSFTSYGTHAAYCLTASLFVSLVFFTGATYALQPAYVPVRAVLGASRDVHSNIVNLPPGGGSLGLFLDESIGEVERYEVDLDTGRDSDGDGVADNDTDNNGHSSLFSGRTFPVSIRPAAGEVRRGMKIKVIQANGDISEGAIDVIFGGSAIGGEVEVVLYPVNAPEMAVPSETRPARKSIRIDVTVKGLSVMFQPVIADGADLSSLEPTWVFGDGEKSYLLAPEHSYGSAGTYEVVLDMKDARTGETIASAKSSVYVKGEIQRRPSGGGLSGSIGFITKVALFVLAVLVLIAIFAFIFFAIESGRRGAPLRDVVTGYKNKFSGEIDAEIAGKTRAHYASPAHVVDPVNPDGKEMPEPVPLEVPDTPPESPKTPQPTEIPDPSESHESLERASTPSDAVKDVKGSESTGGAGRTPLAGLPGDAEGEKGSKPSEPDGQVVSPEHQTFQKPPPVPAWLDKGIKEVSEEEKQSIIKGDISKIVKNAESHRAPRNESENEPAGAPPAYGGGTADEPVAFIKADNVTGTESKNGAPANENPQQEQPDYTDAKPDAKKEKN